MSNPTRFVLAGLLALSVSPALAVPVLSYAYVRAFAKDSGLTLRDSPLLDAGGSASASDSLGTVSTAITATANASGNGITLEGTVTERLGAPHLAFQSYYHPEKQYFTYADTIMYAMSEFYGIITLDAADSGYAYAMTAGFDQTGTSQMALMASLYDITNYAAYYDLVQSNAVSTDGSMGLGTGAQTMMYFGSPTGALVAGHTYTYGMINKILHNGTAEGGTVTDAYGTFSLVIQGPAPAAVPEPASLILCGLGLGGLLWAERKRSASRP